MDCPYCKKFIPGLTGLIEAQNFRKHLRKCRKNLNNEQIVLQSGRKKMFPKHHQGLLEAIEIRSESGQ